MWTTISSYIWGEEDEQIVPGCSVDDTQSYDDWILVDLRENKIVGKEIFFGREIHEGPYSYPCQRKGAKFRAYVLQ